MGLSSVSSIAAFEAPTSRDARPLAAACLCLSTLALSWAEFCRLEGTWNHVSVLHPLSSGFLPAPGLEATSSCQRRMAKCFTAGSDSESMFSIIFLSPASLELPLTQTSDANDRSRRKLLECAIAIHRTRRMSTALGISTWTVLVFLRSCPRKPSAVDQSHGLCANQ